MGNCSQCLCSKSNPEPMGMDLSADTTMVLQRNALPNSTHLLSNDPYGKGREGKKEGKKEKKEKKNHCIQAFL